MKKFFFIFSVLFFAQIQSIFADEIFFTNGDRITGTITKTDSASYIVATENLGTLTISKQVVSEIKGAAAQLPPAPQTAQEQPKLWSGKLFGGFSRQRGNTNSTELSGKIEIKRKVEKKNEFDIKTDGYYSEQNRKMNAQKYSALTRYGWSFGESKKWFHYTQGEADHDRFANIEARYTPSTGLGYWFNNSDDFKLMTEMGAGVAFTNFRTGEKSRGEFVLTPHAYIEKRVIGKMVASEDVRAYPSLSGERSFRVKSEASLKNPITDNLSLKVSLINEYNSEPGEAKKLDTRIVSGIEYTY